MSICLSVCLSVCLSICLSAYLPLYLSVCLSSMWLPILYQSKKSFVECSNHKFLNESDRAQTFNKSSPVLCDATTQGWYRFGGGAGNQMPESCVNTGHCGTQGPGWLNGSHPFVDKGVVRRKVCFHWPGFCCLFETYITVRNCGEFFVYRLTPVHICNLRYCGNGLTTTPGSNAIFLTVTLYRIYSLRHRKCGVRGFIHELFVSKTRTSEVRASEGFWQKQRVNKTPYKALSMSWAVYYTKQENFHWTSFLNANWKQKLTNNRTKCKFNLIQ